MEFPFKFDLNKAQKKDVMLFLGIPALVLIVFGSGFLFLWARNSFSYNFDINKILLISFALSPFLMLLNISPLVLMFESDLKKYNLIDTIIKLSLVLPIMFSITFGISIFMSKYSTSPPSLSFVGAYALMTATWYLLGLVIHIKNRFGTLVAALLGAILVIFGLLKFIFHF